ncbi:hypothetical protein [Methylobacterium sp. J-092]|uniref:hypothetical protein n=1 Tax=Methylobacterium sp. J-092 TaxID=2836667 RepID=UPI001FBC1238|nr:hypothetical protein [Methylobacterium sp. J-092]MCJ2009191.1 hypothetical protein [Methylobacterium sp. J-092]
MKLKTERLDLEWRPSPATRPWHRFRNGFLACYVLAAVVFGGITTIARPDAPASTVALIATFWPYSFGRAIVMAVIEAEPDQAQ